MRAAASTLCAILPVLLAALCSGPAEADDRARMRLTAEHLAGLQRPSGLLLYRFDFLADRSSEEDEIPFVSLTRQAGTAASLALYVRQTGDERALGTVRAALEAFGRLSLPIGKGGVQSALESTRILSTPILRATVRRILDGLGLLYDASGDGKVVSPDGEYDAAWSGITALALLAETHYFLASGDDSFADLRRAWLKGLLALRVPGRGFRELPHVIKESPYANGEAWAALAHYVDAFPDDQAVAEVLAEVDDYMIGKYSRRLNLRFYHWGTMAAAVRAEATSDSRFVQFIKDQARTYLDAKAPEDIADFNSCTPIEGLATAARVIEAVGGDPALLERIKDRVALEMAKNRTLQIQPGQARLDLGGEAYLWSPRMPEYAGAFLNGRYSPITQIGVSAHCLFALLVMDRAGMASEQ